jgi:hypothetical protein
LVSSLLWQEQFFQTSSSFLEMWTRPHVIASFNCSRYDAVSKFVLLSFQNRLEGIEFTVQYCYMHVWVISKVSKSILSQNYTRPPISSCMHSRTRTYYSTHLDCLLYSLHINLLSYSPILCAGRLIEHASLSCDVNQYDLLLFSTLVLAVLHIC